MKYTFPFKVKDKDGTEKEIDGQFRIYSDKDIYSGNLFFVVTVRDLQTGKVYYLKTGEFSEVDSSKEAVPFFGNKAPTLSVPLEHAQNLMDQLWRNGIRPSDSVSIGKGDAQEAHIRDLQKSHTLLIELAQRPPIVLLQGDGQIRPLGDNKNT